MTALDFKKSQRRRKCLTLLRMTTLFREPLGIEIYTASMASRFIRFYVIGLKASSLMLLKEGTF